MTEDNTGDGDSSSDRPEDSKAVEGELQEAASAVKKISEKQPEMMEEMFSVMMQSGGNSLHDKFNDEHITSLVGLMQSHDEREYDLHKTARENAYSGSVQRRVIYGGVILLIFIFVMSSLYLFKDNTDVLVPILSGLGGLGSGILGGIGIGKSMPGG